MNKKAWLVILAVTTAVTVFTFSATWAIRPNSSTSALADKVFEQAKERQGKPLVSITEPLNTDVEALSEEERMAREVASLLAKNDSFISEISKAVHDSVSEELNEWGNNYREDVKNSVQTQAEAYKSEIKRDVDMSLDTMSASIDSKLASSESALISSFDSKLSSTQSENTLAIQSAREYSETLVNSSNQERDQAIQDVKSYVDESSAKSKQYADTISENLSSQLKKISEDIQSYIDAKTSAISDEISAKSQADNAYSDSLWDEAKDHSLSSVKELQADVDQKIAEVESREAKETIDIHKTLPMLGSSVKVDAYRGYAVLSFPEFVTSEDLEYGVEEFYKAYPALEGDVSFITGKKDVVAIYPQSLSSDDVEYGIGVVGELLANIKVPEVVAEPDVEPAKTVVPSAKIEDIAKIEPIPASKVEDIAAISEPTPAVEEKPVETVEEKPVEVAPVVEENPYDFALDMVVPLYGDNINVHLTANDATFAFPAFVSSDMLCDGIVMLISEYPEDTANFDFSIDENSIDVVFDKQYTEKEVRSYLDYVVAYYSSRLDSFLDSETSEVEEKEVVEPVQEVVAVEPEPETKSIDIHKEYDLFGSKVTVNATDDRAEIVLPEYVLEEEIFDGMKYLASAFPAYVNDFIYSADGNIVDITYEPKYTEEELESYIDMAGNAIWAYIQELLAPKAPVTPATPKLDVESEIVEPSVKVPSAPKFSYIDRNLIDLSIRVPASPSFGGSSVAISPDPEIEDAKIPEIRDAIRQVEVDRYLDIVK